MAVRKGWQLELITDEGLHGWGECTPLPSHGSEDFATAESAMAAWQPALVGRRLAEILKTLATRESFAAPSARSAAECAVLDLLAQVSQRPLDLFLGATNPQRTVLANDALGSLDALQAIRPEFSVVKLKLGLASPEIELDALRTLAAQLPAGIRLRLDANRAWDAATAARLLPALAELPVESVEEPLQTPDIDALRELQRILPYPLALDESLTLVNRQTLLDTAPVRRLVLKLAPLGGLLPALALARQAHAAGMECVVTTGIDSSVGTLAAAHLASALNNALAHGLATGDWLAGMTGEMPVWSGDRLVLPGRDGLGYSTIDD